MNQHIAIIGKIPPPIGGVSVHVKRLLDRLEREGVPFLWVDLSKAGIGAFVDVIRRAKLLHLHTSNPFLRLFVGVIGPLLGKSVCITYHGNLGRFGWLANLVDRISVRVALLPILLNQGSFEAARRLNPKAEFVSAFIRPDVPPEDTFLQNMVESFVSRFDHTYATNAFDVAFDSDGLEIYGVSGLIQVFKGLPEIGLVFSDPSGNYKRLLDGKGVNVPANVLVIDREHDFVSVLQRVEGLIRATTTDGDSLSVREGLFLGKVVIASDCVARPAGVITYEMGNSMKLRAAILSACRDRSELPRTVGDDGADVLIQVYRKLLVSSGFREGDGRLVAKTGLAEDGEGRATRTRAS